MTKLPPGHNITTLRFPRTGRDGGWWEVEEDPPALHIALLMAGILIATVSLIVCLFFLAP